MRHLSFEHAKDGWALDTGGLVPAEAPVDRTGHSAEPAHLRTGPEGCAWAVSAPPAPVDARLAI